jgi:hypothetical protein
MGKELVKRSIIEEEEERKQSKDEIFLRFSKC